MKLIDADALMRKFKTASPMAIDGRARQMVEEMPTIEQPEIIRCKDCKHGSPNGRYGCRVYHYKRYETHDMKPDDFCSRAERKEEQP